MCSQCGKPAVYQLSNGMLLCVDCGLKHQQTMGIIREGQERMINYLTDEIEMVSGVRLGGPRFPERKPPVIQNAPVTMNNINIDRSIIGSVNTGTISQLEVNMQSVSQTNEDGAQTIKQFAEAVLKEKKLNPSQKDEILQHVNFLTQQLSLPEKSRNFPVARTVVATLISLINVSASLVTLFEPVKKSLGL